MTSFSSSKMDTIPGWRTRCYAFRRTKTARRHQTHCRSTRILIMDDSTSSVDMETELRSESALQSLMANRTTFIIAHRIQSIMNADQILVFDNGKIVQRGVHEDLLNQPGIYQDIYEIQAKIDSALQEEIDRVNLL